MIVVCLYVMAPLAVLLLLTLKLRNTDLVEAAQTATAGLVTLVPEGLVLLMSVTFAVAAVLGAVGGMLYSPQVGIITPQNMDVRASIDLLIYVALGGRGRLWGAVLGALAVA